MFTTVKRFGSYVLTKENCFSDEAKSTSMSGVRFCTDCAIPSVWTDLTLVSVRAYNHDTSIFRFRLPPQCQKLKLPVGAFFLVLVPSSESNGSGTVRPYTSVSDDDELNKDVETGHFDVLCKRYDEWGKKETIQTHFLFTKTDHSYKPPGIVSNYIHSLKVGDTLKFKHNERCQGRIRFPFPENVTSLTMIAVGVGVAPMIHTLRAIFKRIYKQQSSVSAAGTNAADSGSADCEPVDWVAAPREPLKVVLLYGVRTVADILLREQLDEWQEKYSDNFKVVYCVGSRWANVHWGAKSKTEYKPPPPPDGFQQLKNAELGWVNEEKIRKYAHPPSTDTRVFVCGLPGVYEQLCGGRDSVDIKPCSVLNRIGYTKEMVVKL